MSEDLLRTARQLVSELEATEAYLRALAMEAGLPYDRLLAIERRANERCAELIAGLGGTAFEFALDDTTDELLLGMRRRSAPPEPRQTTSSQILASAGDLEPSVPTFQPIDSFEALDEGPEGAADEANDLRSEETPRSDPDTTELQTNPRIAAPSRSSPGPTAQPAPTADAYVSFDRPPAPAPVDDEPVTMESRAYQGKRAIPSKAPAAAQPKAAARKAEDPFDNLVTFDDPVVTATPETVVRTVTPPVPARPTERAGIPSDVPELDVADSFDLIPDAPDLSLYEDEEVTVVKTGVAAEASGSPRNISKLVDDRAAKPDRARVSKAPEPLPRASTPAPASRAAPSTAPASRAPPPSPPARTTKAPAPSRASGPLPTTATTAKGPSAVPQAAATPAPVASPPPAPRVTEPPRTERERPPVDRISTSTAPTASPRTVAPASARSVERPEPKPSTVATVGKSAAPTRASSGPASAAPPPPAASVRPASSASTVPSAPPKAAPPKPSKAPAPAGRVTSGLYGGSSVPTIRESDEPRPRAAAVQLNASGSGGRVIGQDEEDEPIEIGAADFEEDIDDDGTGFAIKLQQIADVEDDEEAGEISEEDLEVIQPAQVVAVGPTPEEVRQMSLRAQNAAAGGDLQAAADLYSDVIDADPDNVPAHVARGRLYLDLGDYSRAMSDFMVAEDIAPNDPEPQVAIGDLYFARKDYGKAIEYFNDALKFSPTHPMAHCRRGISHYYRKNYKEAVDDLLRAERLDPDIPNIQTYVSMARKKVKR